MAVYGIYNVLMAVYGIYYVLMAVYVYIDNIQ